MYNQANLVNLYILSMIDSIRLDQDIFHKFLILCTPLLEILLSWCDVIASDYTGHTGRLIIEHLILLEISPMNTGDHVFFFLQHYK